MPDLLTRTVERRKPLNLERGGGFIFYISLAIFLLVLASYGGLFFLNRAQEAAKEEFTAQLRLKEEELGTGLVERIFSLDAALRSIGTLVSSHVFASNVFRFLEKNTHPQVRFDSFSFSAENRKVDLTGAAASFTVVAHQVSLMEFDPLVEKITFGGLSVIEKGLVGFGVSIVFNDTLLKLKP